MTVEIVRDLLSTVELDDVRRRLAACHYQYMPLDRRCQDRESVYNPPLHDYHFRLRRLVERAFSVEVMPSFMWSSRYYPGAELRRHTDRRECVYALDIQVDSVAGAAPWPLYVEDESGSVTEAVLRNGDGVLYTQRCPHWRHRQPDGQRVTILAMFYVPTDWRLGIA